MEGESPRDLELKIQHYQRQLDEAKKADAKQRQMFDLYNTKKFEKYKHISKKGNQQTIGSPFQ